MTSFIKIGIGILTVVLMSGCIFWGNDFHDDELHDFEFRADDNPEFSGDSLRTEHSREVGTIKVLMEPYPRLEGLVPWFRTGALRVTCEGKTVTPGETKLDFRTPKTFRVEAADGSVKDWVVTVDQLALKLSQFLLFAGPIFTGSNFLFVDKFIAAAGTATVKLPHSWLNESLGLQLDCDWGYVPRQVLLDGAEVRLSDNQVMGYDGSTSADVFSADVMRPHTLTLIAGGGKQVTYSFTFELAELAFSEFKILKDNNPSLKADLRVTLDPAKKSIAIRLPYSTEAGALKAQFQHPGLKVRQGAIEVVSGTTPLDLSASSTLTIEGAEGAVETWALEVTRDPPSTSKSLTSIAFYWASGSAVLERPPSSSKIFGVDLDPSEGVIDWDPSSNTYFSKKGIYVAITTNGSQVTAQGKTLTQGALYDSYGWHTGNYDNANWLDFTNPVEVTMIAEDGSTQVLTITMRNP